MPVRLTCENCGETFEVPPSRENEARFCSRECSGEFRSQKKKTEYECGECGETFVDLKSRDRVYCSNECKQKAQQKRVEITCEQCGDGFEVVEAREERARFCSNDCKHEWRSENVVGENHPNYVEPEPTNCKGCGKTVYRKPHYIKKYDTYCESCREELNTPASKTTSYKDKECDWCGDTFKVPENNPNNLRFCGHECYGEWRSENIRGGRHHNWNGGPTFYAPGWTKQLRSEVRERDNFECQSCGMGQETHIEEYGRKLEVHHIRKAKSFEENDESMHDKENLITLCRSCHFEWEKMSPLKPE